MKNHMTLGERLKRAHWGLLALAVLLSIIGIVSISAATQTPEADSPFARVTTDYASSQMRWLVIGLCGCLLTLAVPYRRIVDFRYVFYGLGLVLLLLVLAVGQGKSAGRWIRVAGFQFQPSELMKVILVITLAGFIRYQREHRHLRGLVLPFGLTLVPLLLVMRQPDLGTALLFLPILFVILFVAGAQPKHLGMIGLAGLVVAIGMWFMPGVLRQYQKNRVLTFVAQDSEDPALIRGMGYQGHHSRMVVATSDFFGKGTGQETHESVRLLSERHSDFVFR